jgi:hypothetical protein
LRHPTSCANESLFGRPGHAGDPGLTLACAAFDALAPLGVDEEGLSKAGNYALVFGLGGAAGAAATWILNYYEIENSPSAGWPSTTA